MTLRTADVAAPVTARDFARRDPETGRGTRRRLATLALAMILIALVGLALDPPGAASLTERRVAVYGDSIIWEAQAALRTYAGPDVDLTVSAAGGTALCDFADKIADDAASGEPELLIIGFTGNTFTPCTQRSGPPTNPDDLRALYQADLDALLTRVRPTGVPVLLVGAPPGRGLDGTTVWTPVNDAWRELAATWARRGMDISYADVGAALADPLGNWTPTMACLPIEGLVQGCDEGRILVRAPDSIHLCPEVVTAVEGVVPRCSVWNAGAWRYAQGIIEAAERELELELDVPVPDER